MAQALYSSRSFVHWILIVDHGHGKSKNSKHDRKRQAESQIEIEKQIDQILEPFNISFSVHNSFSTTMTKRKKKVKGHAGRLKALRILRAATNTTNGDGGVIFFADDDNTYDSQLFHEMKDTRLVSMWPVGCLTKHGVGTPVVDGSCGNSVRAIYDSWIGARNFPVDFAGFAVNLGLLLRNFHFVKMEGIPSHQEDTFLQSLSQASGFELQDITALPVGGNCTKILAWHTKESQRKYKNWQNY
jgi:hypothetical protein